MKWNIGQVSLGTSPVIFDSVLQNAAIAADGHRKTIFFSVSWISMVANSNSCSDFFKAAIVKKVRLGLNCQSGCCDKEPASCRF